MESTNTKIKVDMVLPIILLSYFMILLDNSIVFTGTVKIAQELALNSSQLSWVSNAYALTFGGLLLFGGRSGDIFGRKKMFSFGLMVFIIGSLAVAMSQTGSMIIFSRAFQGIGSAILAPTTLALLMDNYQGEARARAITAYGATAGLGSSIGLVLGGILASEFSWRDGFFINVPVGIILLIMTWIFVKEKEATKGKIDFVGAITSVIGMIALVYSIDGESQHLLSFLVAVLFLGYFVYHESKTKTPLMPLSLFKDRERLGAYISRFFYLAGMFSFWFLVPQLLQDHFGFSPLMAGVGFFPITISVFLSSTQTTRFTKWLGNSKLLLTGLVLNAIGMGSMILFHSTSNHWLGIAVPMIIIGVAQGGVLSPLTTSGIAHTSDENAGAASGVVNMVHQIGGSVGLSLVIALSTSINQPIERFHHQMIFVGLFAVLALIAAVVFILPKRKEQKG